MCVCVCVIIELDAINMSARGKDATHACNKAHISVCPISAASIRAVSPLSFTAVRAEAPCPYSKRRDAVVISLYRAARNKLDANAAPAIRQAPTIVHVSVWTE